MPCIKKGMAPYVVGITVFSLATIVIVFTMSTDIGSGAGRKAANTIDNIKAMALTKEVCIDLDKSGDDRKSGAIDVYDGANTPALAQVPVENTQAYSLYFKPAVIGVPFTGGWNLKEWKVTCEGVKDGSPYTYTLVKWDYAAIYPKGFLPLEYKSLRTRALIDASEIAYKPEWKCAGGAKVIMETSSAGWLGGTDENVELCYYTKRKSF